MLHEGIISLLFAGTNAAQRVTAAPQPAEPIGINWLVIVLLVAVVLLWSPRKLPELARSLGQAKREFDKALHEVSTAASTPQLPLSPPDAQLVDTARRLGISTEGKSAEQITQEIVSRAELR